MLAGEGQAKHWMKLAQWEPPGRDEKIKQEATALPKNIHQAITIAFPKPVDGNRIQA